LPFEKKKKKVIRNNKRKQKKKKGKGKFKPISSGNCSMALKETSRYFNDLALRKVAGSLLRKLAVRSKEFRLENGIVRMKSSSVKAFPFKLKERK